MTPISRHAQRVLGALAAQRAFRQTGNQWCAGTLIAPDSLILELERRNLVARVSGGSLRLTPMGEARHARGQGGPRKLVERQIAIAGSDSAVPAFRSVTVNLEESPLGWLMARGRISARQFEAGERLRADWTLAGMAPRITMRWDADVDRSRSAGALDPTCAQIAARQRFDAAIACAGSGLADILWRVVCAGEGLSAAESALGWPQRAGKLVLQFALDRIAEHYGIG